MCNVRDRPSTSSFIIDDRDNFSTLTAIKNQNNSFQYGAGSRGEINIISKHTTFFNKFNVEGVKITFRVNDMTNPNSDILKWLENAFCKLIEEITKSSVKGSKISLSISLPNSPHVKPIWSNLKPIDQLDGNHILGLISNVNQSNATFLSDDAMQVEANIVNFPFASGNGKINPKILNENEVLLRKYSVIDVGKDGDVYCLPRSICYAMRQTKTTTTLKLDKLARDLCKSAKVKINESAGCTLTDLYKFQKFLKDYQVIVFDNLNDPESIIFKLPFETASLKKIYLYYSQTQQHFYVIKSLKGFFTKKYACNLCDKVSNIKYHKCSSKCQYCQSIPLCPFSHTTKDCNECNRTFRDEDCFLNHLQNKIGEKNICDTFKICKLCNKFLDFSKPRKENHICNEYLCQICFKVVSPDHLCYIKPYKGKKSSKFLIIFFDCESTQNTLYKNTTSSYLHIVNLIVAQQVCFACYTNSDINSNCSVCGERQQTFEYNEEVDVVKRFIDYVFMHRPYVNQIYCIAHNFQAYDGHFLISEILSRNLTIHPVMNGTKIIKMACENVTFIDSLNFLSFSIAKFPSVFEIQNFSKGFYPYFFNTIENLNYVGKYPPPEMYGYNSMKEKERQVFLKWYNSKSLEIFNNKNEMLKYCINDVNILRLGCVSFMRDFLDITGINPFVESLTIASACMLVFRKNFLKENTLGIMPKHGYSNSKNVSFLSLKWLSLKNSETNNEILCALNTGEVKLEKGGSYVDGFNPKTNTVYEFFGCFYHGCPDCFKVRASNVNGGKMYDTLNQRYESTRK